LRQPLKDSRMQTSLSSEHQDCITLLEDLFKKGIAESVSSLLGEAAEAEIITRSAPAAKELWFRSELRPSSHGYLAFGVAEEPWLKIGRRILTGGEEESADNETVLSTLREIGAQVTGSILSTVNHAYRKQIEVQELHVLDSLGEESHDGHTSHFRLTLADGFSVSMTLVFPHTLVQGLVPGRPSEPAAILTSVDSKKLERLLDVEMPVSVSIGRAHMPLKDVIKLTTGSVVELNRNVSELVDIVVNNCVVARGDVVVVEGNFGVRVREVLSKEDRLRRVGPRVG
jgi:flagellar motor switch protein FliN